MCESGDMFGKGSMKKITLKEIALKFGVSVSTVSKAINNSHEISDDLKQRIQKFAKEQHYKPNRIAVSLLKRSTKTIGVVVPNILNYFFTQVFYGIEKTANARGYHIVSCFSDESYLKEIKTVELLGSGTIDGLIMSLSKETQDRGKIDHLHNFLENQIPLVLFDRVTEKIECDKVVVDDHQAGYKTTKYLLQTGCKSIAMVSPIHGSSVGKLRLEGYKEALKEENIGFDDKLIVKVKKDDDLELLMSFLLSYAKIDAIIALDEITAVDVLNIVKEKGIKVPEELSIIGFTNGRLSKYVTPALTMVSQHGKYIGELAANILIDRIETQSLLPFTTKLVKTSLIERDSTLSIN
ncbi:MULTISPECIES: LacI family DNA-binding transcriptional regulator [Flavobacteriaceae]|uniref:LacI family DNA-binding transcriptional regulator n=1 Tax=Flavobacteriaceae TaxID=49546 RepID=UPI001490F00C|nr:MULTISPECIES: LacI family DNA-binding transcriptional regulator [Allomuricauda]MDC6366515.1 LacI family DNA-binding transcriptional regulator [Muricauda sp. AC10]